MIDALFGNYVSMALTLIAAALIYHFVTRYFLLALALREQIENLTTKISSIKSDGQHPSQIKSSLSELFLGTELAFFWDEYEETLHEQKSSHDGELIVAAVRSTVSAEAFINVENVVDPKLGAEYFKHLPGILTGMGIIGTFYGLIVGLESFSPNAAPEDLAKGLDQLLQHVRGAFVFSGFAIASAISITLVEKWLYASCAKCVGNLSQALDGLFRSGVGEEYLSSLVTASETSATQTRQLKEAMVEDLKVLLTNLTERQITATQRLSEDLGNKIQEGLREPLAAIADTVKKASGQNTEAVGETLNNLMTSFLQQMKESTGTQMTGLAALLQQTAASMSSVEVAVRGLVADMQASGEASRTGVESAIHDLMSKLSAHQTAQSEAVSSTTNAVLSQLEGAILRMTEVQEASAQARRNQDAEAEARLKDQINIVTETGRTTLQAAGAAIGQLNQFSTSTIADLAKAAGAVSATVSSLNAAMERLASTASELAKLEERAGQSSQQIMNVSGQMTSAAQALNASTTQMGVVGARFEALSGSVTMESEVRRELLRSMEKVSADAKSAGASLVDLASGVRGALEAGFDEFGTGISRVISEQLNAYQQQLGAAVSMLTGALEELAEYAGSRPDSTEED